MILGFKRALQMKISMPLWLFMTASVLVHSLLLIHQIQEVRSLLIQALAPSLELLVLDMSHSPVLANMDTKPMYSPH